MKKLFLIIVALVLFIGLVFYFFTLQSFQFVETSKMKMKGVREITSEYHYYEKNNCTTEKPCQCVLLLHGLGDMAITWEKILTTDKNLFRKGIYFFAPDLTRSKSAKLNTLKDYNVKEEAKRLSSFFLPKCETWTIVANSYGAWVAVFMALESSKVKNLLLLAPAGIKQDYSHITNYFLHPSIKEAKEFYKKLYFKTRNVPDFIFERVVERIKNQTVIEQLKSIEKDDFLDTHLKSLKIPVIYVWGEADKVIPSEWASQYIKLTPHSKFYLAKKCGHVLQKECPKEVSSKLNLLLDTR